MSLVFYGREVDVVNRTPSQGVADGAAGDPDLGLADLGKAGTQRSQALVGNERRLDPLTGAAAHRRTSRGTRAEIPQVTS